MSGGFFFSYTTIPKSIHKPIPKSIHKQIQKTYPKIPKNPNLLSYPFSKLKSMLEVYPKPIHPQIKK
jgi:hypothetical protein